MDRMFAERVYQSLIGLLVTPIPGVKDAFAEGMPCEQWYSEMLEAYARLRERLGVEDEDCDVEIMIQSFLSIQKELCIQMYRYGCCFREMQ